MFFLSLDTETLLKRKRKSNNSAYISAVKCYGGENFKWKKTDRRAGPRGRNQTRQPKEGEGWKTGQVKAQMQKGSRCWFDCWPSEPCQAVWLVSFPDGAQSSCVCFCSMGWKEASCHVDKVIELAASEAGASGWMTVWRLRRLSINN